MVALSDCGYSGYWRLMLATVSVERWQLISITKEKNTHDVKVY